MTRRGLIGEEGDILNASSFPAHLRRVVENVLAEGRSKQRIEDEVVRHTAIVNFVLKMEEIIYSYGGDWICFS